MYALYRYFSNYFGNLALYRAKLSLIMKFLLKISRVVRSKTSNIKHLIFTR